ncbi:MAG: arsenate reductase family protein [Streptococcaceae bacterium]|jgi:arsenate reductase|nr:arsenate reductase family protein [Streptococcaceae bacterium]
MYDFYWYPKCSTCRKAKAQLDSQHVSYQAVDMIKTPPSAELLTKWLSAGNFEMRKFFNSSGMKYRELGLKDKVASMSVQEAAQILASDGMLIKRPLIVKDGELIQIGYKEDKYKTL